MSTISGPTPPICQHPERAPSPLRDAQIIMLIRMSQDHFTAQRALNAAKAAGVAEEAQRKLDATKERAEQEAQQERQQQLLPRTLGQRLLAPFKACFKPVRR